ncbi:cell division protein FtsZ [Flaviaesturariibacter flavus]|uniref:Cell division protein FtsZ n=1 Tax=Flaviaesturariibacter flavus TaxID=2502780 RepID=A0A4V2NVR6_9BACT|nr:cell division protein FtsZ [Flaviaesturariibacter flavus]TCJ14522.1 cell division protein FtsZ [Flaviaesturariibacter flavus]
MIHFDLPKEKSSIIKVIGIGGGGSNAVNHMFSQNIEGVNFIIANTDAQSIATSPVPNKVQLGPHLTQGLGAGANPEIGRQATEESLEELKATLEVNTKMAFVTAGMGGGTGTGGAPIIAKVCKDLGILTVGIVTTPFAYEGRKRQIQAEEGIKNLKNYVDTLLVISNDKLRHQFGNLKMREAFAKADNVLATAAKCITDVINSTGQINVDFADVCTVMRNGGVAILGNAACDGEGRAQRAIEEALNSPLLNDNDIRGAKWILININSSEGEHEFTMDEVDIIQNYLLSQAGEHTDVILGLGYDNTLGAKLGITLIATGFEHKDPFTARTTTAQATPVEAPREEKIVMTLGEQPAAPKAEAPAPVVAMDPLAPQLVDENFTPEPAVFAQPELVFFEADVPAVEDTDAPLVLQLKLKDEEAERERERLELEAQKKQLDDKFEQLRQNIIGAAGSQPAATNGIPSSAAAGGYLARPSNIYAESKPDVSTPTSAGKPVPGPAASNEEEETFQMHLVIRNDQKAADEAVSQQAHMPNKPVDDPAVQDAAGEEKRRAAERLQKLRNLSFNLHSADPNNEFESVPAYIRRNMELQNNQSTVENFYSNYTVQPDGNNGAHISTINTFLDGKKPD